MFRRMDIFYRAAQIPSFRPHFREKNCLISNNLQTLVLMLLIDFAAIQRQRRTPSIDALSDLCEI